MTYFRISRYFMSKGKTNPKLVKLPETESFSTHRAKVRIFFSVSSHVLVKVLGSENLFPHFWQH